MKNLRKLFLTSTLMLSGISFLGAMGNQTQGNQSTEAQLKALSEKNNALKKQVEALQHQVAQSNSKYLKRLQKRTQKNLAKAKK